MGFWAYLKFILKLIIYPFLFLTIVFIFKGQHELFVTNSQIFQFKIQFCLVVDFLFQSGLRFRQTLSLRLGIWLSRLIHHKNWVFCRGFTLHGIIHSLFLLFWSFLREERIQLKNVSNFLFVWHTCENGSVWWWQSVCVSKKNFKETHMSFLFDKRENNKRFKETKRIPLTFFFPAYSSRNKSHLFTNQIKWPPFIRLDLYHE